MSGFILILASTIVIAFGTLFPGAGPLPFFATAWWFKVLGALVLAGNLGGLVIAWVQLKWASLVSHLGIALLFAGIVADGRSMTIRADLTEGETITTFNMNGKELPLGFALTLVDFQEEGYTSRVRVNQGSVRTVAPSHSVSYRGWLLLQESFDLTGARTHFVLVAETGETLRVATGDRFAIPGTDLEMSFDPDYVMSRDTLFRFRLYESGTEKVSGFMSSRTVVPPTIRLPIRLLDYELGNRYVSTLQLVKHPGAWIVFVAFGVVLVGLIMLAVERPGVRDGSRPKA